MGNKRKRPVIKTKEILGIEVVTEYNGQTLITEESGPSLLDCFLSDLPEQRAKLGSDHPEVAATLYECSDHLICPCSGLEIG